MNIDSLLTKVFHFFLTLLPYFVIWLFFHVFVYLHLNLVFILTNILFVSNYKGCSVYVCAGVLLFFHLMLSVHGRKIITILNYLLLLILFLMNIYFIYFDFSVYVFIYLNNLLILYAMLLSCNYMILRNNFINKYDIEPGHASLKYFFSQTLSFGMRYGLGHMFNIWGIIFKPITDLLSESIFQVNNMKVDLYILSKAKDHAVIAHSISIATTLLVIYYYFNFNDESLDFIILKMSYVDMLYRIMNW